MNICSSYLWDVQLQFLIELVLDVDLIELVLQLVPHLDIVNILCICSFQ